MSASWQLTYLFARDAPSRRRRRIGNTCFVSHPKGNAAENLFAPAAGFSPVHPLSAPLDHPKMLLKQMCCRFSLVRIKQAWIMSIPKQGLLFFIIALASRRERALCGCTPSLWATPIEGWRNSKRRCARCRVNFLPRGRRPPAGRSPSGSHPDGGQGRFRTSSTSVCSGWRLIFRLQTQRMGN